MELRTDRRKGPNETNTGQVSRLARARGDAMASAPQAWTRVAPGRGELCCFESARGDEPMPVTLSAIDWMGSISGFLPCGGAGGLRLWILPAPPTLGSGPGAGPRSRRFGARPIALCFALQGGREDRHRCQHRGVRGPGRRLQWGRRRVAARRLGARDGRGGDILTVSTGPGQRTSGAAARVHARQGARAGFGRRGTLAKKKAAAAEAKERGALLANVFRIGSVFRKSCSSRKRQKKPTSADRRHSSLPQRR